MVLYAPFFMNIFQIGKIGNLGTCSLKKIDNSLNLDLYNKFINDKNIIYYKKIDKGGFLAALYKICEEFKKEDIMKDKEDRILKSNILGLKYYLLRTDILQSTIEISNIYDINPYRLYTDNAYIIFSNSESLEGCRLIGKTTNDKKRIRMDIDTNSFLTKDYKDEINKVLINFRF